MSSDPTIDIYGTDAIEPINPAVNQTDLFSYDIDSYDPMKPAAYNPAAQQAGIPNPYADPRLTSYQQPLTTPYQQPVAQYQPVAAPYPQQPNAQYQPPAAQYQQQPAAQYPPQQAYNNEYSYNDPSQQVQPVNQAPVQAAYQPPVQQPMYQQQPPMNQSMPPMQQAGDNPPAPRVPPFKLFVGQLTEQTDIPALNAMFQGFGPVDEAVILLEKGTGRSKCCGFVTFADQASGERAIAEMHERITVDGARRPLIVRWSTDSKSAQPQPPPQAAKKRRHDRFDQGMQSYEQQNMGPAVPNPMNPRCKLFVSNLQPSQSEADLEQMFGPFGQLHEIFLVREKGGGRSKCVAFVRYNFEGDAQSAIAALNGKDGMRVEVADERRGPPNRSDRGGSDRHHGQNNMQYGMPPNQYPPMNQNMHPSPYPPAFDPLAPAGQYPPYGVPPMQGMPPPMNAPYPPYYSQPPPMDGQFDPNMYPPQQPMYPPPVNQAGMPPQNGDPNNNGYNGYPPSFPPHVDNSQAPAFNNGNAAPQQYKPDQPPRMRPQNDRDLSRDPVNWQAIPEGANLCVENLPESMNESDLTSMFGRLGSIVSVKISRDSARRSKGTGYVTFSSADSGRQAVKEFDGTTHNGKRITVRIKPPPGGARRDRGDDRDRRDRSRGDRDRSPPRGSRESYRHRPY